MKKNPKIELIYWKDPTSHNNGWIELTEYRDKTPCICKSVGWVIYEERKKDGNITIVPHLTTDEKGIPVEGGGDINLPKSLIVRRVEITI